MKDNGVLLPAWTKLLLGSSPIILFLPIYISLASEMLFLR